MSIRTVFLSWSFALFSVLFCSSEAQAGTKVESFVFAGKPDTLEATPALIAFSYIPLGTNGKWAATVFALSIPSWGQVYAGPAVQANDWLNLNVSMGLETIPSAPWRTAGTVLATPGRFFLLNIVEYGGSGPWTKVVWQYRPAWSTAHIGGFGFGVLSQHYQGSGPRVDLFLFNGEQGQPQLNLYAAPIWSGIDWSGGGFTAPSLSVFPNRVHFGASWSF